MVKPIVNLECLNIIDAFYPYIIEMKFFFSISTNSSIFGRNQMEMYYLAGQ